jgi:hypothetical protein
MMNDQKQFSHNMSSNREAARRRYPNQDLPAQLSKDDLMEFNDKGN